MQISVPDADFYERKIARLEKDIVALHELRTAEDFQIKYELLLRQSQQENILIRKKQQVEKIRINEILLEEIEKVNQQWIMRMQIQREEQAAKFNEQSKPLLNEIQQLKDKNKQLQSRAEQMDDLLLKNKKIAKDLQSLQEIIQQNRINNEKQKENEIRICKQIITRKYEEKIRRETQKLEQQINRLKQKCDKQEIQLLRAQLIAQESIKDKQKTPCNQSDSQLLQKLNKEIQKLHQLIAEKNEQMEVLHQYKISDEERHSEKVRELNAYNKELEEKIFKMQQEHEIQLFNLKKRMEEVRKEQLAQKQRQCEIIEKKHLNDIEAFNDKLQRQKTELERIKRVQQAQISKLKEDKLILQKKIQQLKNRLKDKQENQQIGETQNLINSLKNLDKRFDFVDDYDNGVTFLEKQLRKAAIKIEKKNAEVKHLIQKVSHITAEFEKEINENKQRAANEIRDLTEKVRTLEEQAKELNQQIRNRDKALRDQEFENEKVLNQLKAEVRSLNNLNSDLQRDYNRILENKKAIEKSWREERQRSISSKSQIAVTKKEKWLELERQKHQIEIIYRQKQEQMKTSYEIIVRDMRVQNDKLRRQKELLEQQLNNCKNKLKSQKGKDQSEKENVFSDYQKKLASVELEIALTENLYSQLMKAKSRIKKEADGNEGQNPLESKVHVQVQRPKDQGKRANLARQQNRRQESRYQRSQKKSERSIKQFDKISLGESYKISGKDLNEEPLYLDRDELEEENSPTFKMMHSFNPNHR